MKHNGNSRTSALVCIADDVTLGEAVRLAPFVNLYGCHVGSETRIGAFVEVQSDAQIGSRCKISSHSFVCSGVTIEDDVFIGHGVVFINDRYPRATNSDGSCQESGDWRLERTVVRRGASIGSGAIIMGGVEIGASSMIGAGAVVTRDVPPHSLVKGSPARIHRRLRETAHEMEGE